MTPSPRRSAVSTESARRAASGSGCSASKGRPSASAWRTMRRSTTTSMLCRLYLSSAGASSRSMQLAVHADAHEALPAGGLEDALALRLAVLDERAEDEDARAVRQGPDAVHDLLHAHARDLAAAARAVRVADAREEQAQVVVDLRHRADRGTRVAAGALLVDGDGRREPLDVVDVRLLHLAQELAGVGGEALHVAALALRVDGVEGQAGLAAAGQPGDDDQPVPRQLDGDVLEVVLARAAHDEQILGHTRSVTHEGSIRTGVRHGGQPCRWPQSMPSPRQVSGESATSAPSRAPARAKSAISGHADTLDSAVPPTSR